MIDFSPSWNIWRSDPSPNTALELSRNFTVFDVGVNETEVIPVAPKRFTISLKVEIPVMFRVCVSKTVIEVIPRVDIPESTTSSKAPSNLVAVTIPVNSAPPFT